MSTTTWGHLAGHGTATRLTEPGCCHGPLEGSPSAGHVSTGSRGTEVGLHIGEIAGRPVDIITGDLLWLEHLEHEVRTARARLSQMAVAPQGAAA